MEELPSSVTRDGFADDYKLVPDLQPANLRSTRTRDIAIVIGTLEVIAALVILVTLPVQHGPQEVELATSPGVYSEGEIFLPTHAHVHLVWWTLSGLPVRFTLSDNLRWLYGYGNGLPPAPGGTVDFTSDSPHYSFFGGSVENRSETILVSFTFTAPFA